LHARGSSAAPENSRSPRIAHGDVRRNSTRANPARKPRNHHRQLPEEHAMNIEGSVVLVTGANRGLGAAYAEALLQRGAAKVYAGARRPETISDARLVPVRL